jgi:hypothetical protein
MATEPPTTTTYNFPLVPAKGETNAADFKGEWGHLLNYGEFADGTASTDTNGLIAYLDSLFDGTEQTKASPTVPIAGGIPSVATASDLPSSSEVPNGTQYYVEDENEVYILK